MLEALHIENVAVIRRADITFSPGFSVLSGETGAGKSILIDSIGFLLGKRGVGADLYGGYGCAQGRAAAGGKENEMRACGGEIGDRHQIVTRAVEERKSLLAYRIAVIQHVHHGGRAGFLHAAEGFFLKS